MLGLDTRSSRNGDGLGRRHHRPGERVRHARFGPGTILRLVGPANRRRATIRFDAAGTRELALDVARLERDDY